MKIPVQLTVNGVEHDTAVAVRSSLVDFLRDDLGLTGTKVGCEHGVCGACTVLLDGRPVRSCLMLAVQAGGREIGTVEGLASGPALTPLQESFQRHHALQCGFCTAGFLLTATALLVEDPTVDRDGIRDAMIGNLCRCTGYQTIVDAVFACREADQ